MRDNYWDDNEWFLSLYHPDTDDKIHLPEKIRSEVVKLIGEDGAERVEYLLLNYLFSVDRRPAGKTVSKKINRMKELLAEIEKIGNEINSPMTEIVTLGDDEDVFVTLSKHDIERNIDDQNRLNRFWESYSDFRMESFKVSEYLNSVNPPNTNSYGIKNRLRMIFLVGLGRTVLDKHDGKLYRQKSGCGGYGENLLKSLVEILRPFLPENKKEITKENIRDAIKYISK